MEIRWFGEPWGAAICREKYRRVSPPAGKKCVCGEEIEADDRGVVMAAVGEIEGSYTANVDGKVIDVVAEHIDCFLESIIPGESHLMSLVSRKP